MLKSNFHFALSSMALVAAPISALPLREAAPSFIAQNQARLAFAAPPQRSTTTQIDRSSKQSPTALKYRSEDTMTQDVYTDRLWQSALVADSIRVELQPVHNEVATKSKKSDDGLVETAKAFIPVVIEIGVVAAVAAAVNPMN